MPTLVVWHGSLDNYSDSPYAAISSKEMAMARPQSFPVRLTQEQRESLEQLRDQPLARKQQYRRDILLRAHEGDTDREIADDLGVHPSTVQRVRRRFAEQGLDVALTDRP